MELPWWALSPSPFTLAFYAICSLYGGLKIYTIYGHNYRRLKPLAALADGIFMFGFVVVTLDSAWIIICGLRFGWEYGLPSVLQLVFCLLRNGAITALCLLFTKDYLADRAQASTFLMYLANVAFMAFWFALSPSPAYTDWTFAIRNGYPTSTILASFLVSHVAGKTLVGLTWLTYWKTGFTLHKT